MAKQFATFYVSWRDSKSAPFGGPFSTEAAYGRAAAEALEAKLNDLAEEGWVIDRIIPAGGYTATLSAAFTIIAFK